MTWFIALDPTVQAAIVTGIFGFLVTVAGLVGKMLVRQRAELAEVREHAAAARYQVQNSHTTNLRDDLDKVIEGVQQLLDGQKDHQLSISDLRVDLAWERRERMDLAHRVARLDHLGVDIVA